MVTPFGFSFQDSYSQTRRIFHPTENGGGGRWEEGHFVQVAFACSKSHRFLVPLAQNGGLRIVCVYPQYDLTQAVLLCHLFTNDNI